MKVITPGRQQKGWSTEAECTGAGNGKGGCGAQLLVEQDDLFITYSIVRNETARYVTFRCVSCGVLTDIPSYAAPPPLICSKLPTYENWLKSRPLPEES